MSKKIVMLFSCSFQPFQGRYRRVYLEAKTLREAGHDVTILAWDRESKYPEEETRDGIRIRRFCFGSRFTGTSGPVVNLHHHMAFDQWLVRTLLRTPLDAIHCFNLDTILPGLLVAKLRRKRCLLDLCEPNYYYNWPKAYGPLRAATELLEKASSRFFDFVLVHNLYQIRKFQSLGVRGLEQIASVPERWMSPGQLREKHSQKKQVTLGRIGTIFEDNGIEELLDAFARLSKLNGNVRLLLAGKILDSFAGTFGKCLAPVRGDVEVTGEFDTSQLADLYGRLDVSISLNRRRSVYMNITPTKFFDSLAYGVPILTSEIGDIRDLNERYECAVLVDETNPESILEGMTRLAGDRNLRLHLAQNGIQLIQEQYNWNIMSKRLLGVYEKLFN